MTLRQLLFLSTGAVCLSVPSLPAAAGGFSIGFSYSSGPRYYRTYVPRTYVYRECSPVVFYDDYCWPEVVTYDPPPRVYYYRECRPRATTVVYRDYVPRYYRSVKTYYTRSCDRSYRVYRTPGYCQRYY
jgi:hypothetical protein